jgi:hypothetical protein
MLLCILASSVIGPCEWRGRGVRGARRRVSKRDLYVVNTIMLASGVSQYAFSLMHIFWLQGSCWDSITEGRAGTHAVGHVQNSFGLLHMWGSSPAPKAIACVTLHLGVAC